MARERVLIVDDNPINLQLARVVLTNSRYLVRTAGDAGEALRILEEWRPSLILMDIQMPGMDGLELTRRLKADAPTCGIVILALTAYAMKGDKQRMLEAGCDGYVAKPIDINTLPDVVARHIQGAPPRSGQRRATRTPRTGR